MKKFCIFLLLITIVLVGIFFINNKTSKVAITKEFLCKNYSTSSIDFSEDYDEMFKQVAEIYGKYFTEKGLESAFTNRAIAVGDILKSQGNILQSSCNNIKLNKTKNEGEYAYTIILDVKLINNQTTVIQYNGLVRFENQNSKLIDKIYQLDTSYSFT